MKQILLNTKRGTLLKMFTGNFLSVTGYLFNSRLKISKRFGLLPSGVLLLFMMISEVGHGNTTTPGCINPVSADAGPATVSFCKDQPVLLHGSADGDYTSVTWTTDGDGSFSPDEHTLNVTYVPGPNDLLNNVIHLTLTANADVPCVTANDNIEVHLLDLPLASTTSNSPVCGGSALDMAAAGGVSYVWSGPLGFVNSTIDTTLYPSTPSQSGTYYVTVTDANGCSSLDSVVAVVTQPSVSFSIAPAYCVDYASVLITGNHAPAGIFSGSGITDHGDGTATFNPFTAGVGGPYSILYEYIDIPTGCYNSVAHDVTVNDLPLTSTTSNSPVCAGGALDMVAAGGVSYSWTGPNGFINSSIDTSLFPALTSESGTYYVTVTDANGCVRLDSVIAVVNQTSVSFSIFTAYCVDHSSVLITGNHAPEGTFSGPGITDLGNGTATFVPAAASEGGPYSILYQYTDLATGCSNSIIHDVTVFGLPLTSTSNNSPVCAGAALDMAAGGGVSYYWTGPNGFVNSLIDTTLYPATTGQSGTYYVRITDANGCSSIDSVVAVVHPTYDITLSPVTQCNSYILPWGGTITLTDDYTSSTYATVNGCDSIIHQHVTINYTSSSYDTVNVCNSYTWNSNTYTTSGDHNAGPFTNAAGCDSIAYLHLIIRYSSSSHDTVSVCNSYTWNSNTYTTSGDHNAGPFTNAAGCDSIAYLHLIIRYSSSSHDTVSVCNSYTWNSNTYTTSGDHNAGPFTNAAGCDSIAYLHLIIRYSSSSHDTVSVCNSYTWNANTYTTSGDHNAGPFTNAAGCDSIAYLHLIIRYSSSSHDTVSVCNSYTWNSNTYTTSGDHNAGPFTNAAGCDSIAYLHLIIRYSSSSTVNISFCFGGSYTPPNGTPMTVTGTQITHISNATGCDSAITTSLTVINCVTLNIKAFIQCYYKGSSSMKHVLLNEIVPGSLPYQVDTIVVELHDTVTGSHALLESYKGIIDTTGSLSCVFSNSVLGKYSYIVIRHRNTIETWSANPVTINPVNSYDFTTAATKAYGSNMIDVFGEGIWSFYNADFPQDGIIEASDLNAMEADLVALAVGYYATDVDGDGFVDASDLNFLEANVLRVVQRHHP